jgi:hypothetical protein
VPKHSDVSSQQSHTQSPARPLDLHEWVSFEDDKESRTWVFDATFLRSNWNCIYGAGCKGVLEYDATALAQGCCSHGAHFIDDDDVQTVLNALTRLEPRHWQNYKKGHNKGVLETEDGATKTRVVKGACIFHNQPDFEGGAGCALHIAAVEAGERYIDWKPDVCWQLPLRLEHHTDDNGYVTSTLREWKRRDWGDGGNDFHWWCTESDDAFIGGIPAYEYLRDEIIEMVGQPAYEQMVILLERPNWVPLPHPATRR